MATSSIGVRGETPHRFDLRRTIIWLLLGAVAVVSGYALFAESLMRVATSYRQPEFSHGYIIPLISAWLIWQRRRLIWSLRDRGSPSGWLLVAAGVGFAFLCNAANLDSAPYLGLIPTLIGLGVVALGWSSARLLVVPFGFLVFGFPLPTYAYVDVSTSLQLVSSQLGAGLLDFVGVPVFLEGNVIDLGLFKLQVAEACSGLRYLLPLLSFGVLCAYIYRAPLWAKVLVVLMTVPLTIALNGARIAMTGLFVHFGTQELAEGFMHLFEGWVIFLIALAILFGFMFALLRLLGWRGHLGEMLDFDRMAGMPNGRAPALPERAAGTASPTAVPKPLVAAVATMAAAALLLVPVSMRPQTVPERPGLINYPMQFKAWTGTSRALDPEIERVLGVDDYLLVDYKNRENSTMVNLWVAYYDSQLGDAQIHLPTTCLPGAGWEYVEFGPQRTPFTDFSGERLVVNRGVIANGMQRMVMYFWMEMRGQSLHEAQYVKFVNLRDSLLEGRSDGALVRLFTPIGPDETPADADRRLHEMLERAYPHLAPHVG